VKVHCRPEGPEPVVVRDKPRVIVVPGLAVAEDKFRVVCACKCAPG